MGSQTVCASVREKSLTQPLPRVRCQELRFVIRKIVNRELAFRLAYDCDDGRRRVARIVQLLQWRCITVCISVCQIYELMAC